MRSVVALCLSCVVLAAAPPPSRADQDPAPGRITDKVVCRKDAGQSYALYLPSGYSADRTWPIIYAFDAGARGLVPVQRFQDAAERYGFIVVGSNNSRNGPISVANDAFRAMVTDTTARFAVDPRRVYLAGFSGGARVAVLAALALENAAGVIGAGAGFPDHIQPTGSLPFAYYGTAGTDDFNYPEMKQLDSALLELGLPRWLEVFEGGHDWPPADVCVRAIEWMETQAMRSKIRPMDDALINRILERVAANAEAEEKAGRLYGAYRRYSGLAATLAGLRDVSPFERKARELAASPEVRGALAEEAESVERQRSGHARIVGLADAALTGEDRAAATAELVAALGTLKAQAERPRNDAVRMAARRVIMASWISMNQAATLDMERGQFTRAAERLSLMRVVRPDSPGVDFALARAWARAGVKRSALEALRSAVKKGFSDAAAIDADPDLQSLRGEDGYRAIIAGLRKDVR